MEWMPVGNKDDDVRGRSGLDDHMVDVQKGFGEAKALTERPTSLLVSVLRLQALNKRIYGEVGFSGKDALPKTQREVENQSKGFQSLNRQMLPEDKSQ